MNQRTFSNKAIKMIVLKITRVSGFLVIIVYNKPYKNHIIFHHEHWVSFYLQNFLCVKCAFPIGQSSISDKLLSTWNSCLGGILAQVSSQSSWQHGVPFYQGSDSPSAYACLLLPFSSRCSDGGRQPYLNRTSVTRLSFSEAISNSCLQHSLEYCGKSLRLPFQL